MDDRWELNYDLIPEDIAALTQWLHQRQFKSTKTVTPLQPGCLIGCIILSIPIVLALFIRAHLSDGPIGIDWIRLPLLVLIGYALLFAYWPRFRKWFIRFAEMMSNLGRQQGPVSLQFIMSADEIRSSSGGKTSQQSWSDIEHFVRTDSYVFLIFRKGTAFVIPQRAFNSAEDYQRFCEASQHFMALARASSLTAPPPNPPAASQSSPPTAPPPTGPSTPPP
jgi:hypothetical protein